MQSKRNGKTKQSVAQKKENEAINGYYSKNGRYPDDIDVKLGINCNGANGHSMNGKVNGYDLTQHINGNGHHQSEETRKAIESHKEYMQSIKKPGEPIVAEEDKIPSLEVYHYNCGYFYTKYLEKKDSLNSKESDMFDYKPLYEAYTNNPEFRQDFDNKTIEFNKQFGR